MSSALPRICCRPRMCSSSCQKALSHGSPLHTIQYCACLPIYFVRACKYAVATQQYNFMVGISLISSCVHIQPQGWGWKTDLRRCAVTLDACRRTHGVLVVCSPGIFSHNSPWVPLVRRRHLWGVITRTINCRIVAIGQVKTENLVY